MEFLRKKNEEEEDESFLKERMLERECEFEKKMKCVCVCVCMCVGRSIHRVQGGYFVFCNA